MAEKYGVAFALMFFAVVALYRDWIVSGKRYREVVGQRDRLLRLALRGQRKALQATDLGEALVGGPDGSGTGADDDLES